VLKGNNEGPNAQLPAPDYSTASHGPRTNDIGGQPRPIFSPERAPRKGTEGYSGYTVPTAADERDLDAVGAYLTAHGVRNSLRHFDEVESEESVPEIILDVAREEHATLIVLGLHQRPLIKKRLLGSTAESIVLAASCPVLIVPDVDEPDARP
jgi:nucleotide-binding universal stress UspA family protein